MKTIIIGASLSGKTTLVEYFRSQKIDCIDIDNQLSLSDNEKKYSEVIPKIITDIFAKNEILFFTHTDYLTLDDLRQARSLGFTIFQLELTLPELIKRNTLSGSEELTPWLEDMIDYQNELKKIGLIDKSLDATLPVEKLAKEIT